MHIAKHKKIARRPGPISLLDNSPFLQCLGAREVYRRCSLVAPEPRGVHLFFYRANSPCSWAVGSPAAAAARRRGWRRAGSGEGAPVPVPAIVARVRHPVTAAHEAGGAVVVLAAGRRAAESGRRRAGGPRSQLSPRRGRGDGLGRVPGGRGRRAVAAAAATGGCGRQAKGGGLLEGAALEVKLCRLAPDLQPRVQSELNCQLGGRPITALRALEQRKGGKGAFHKTERKRRRDVARHRTLHTECDSGIRGGTPL